MINQGLTTSFKDQILHGVHDLTTDSLYISLYTAFASLDEATTVYTSVSEITGTGYVAGGKLLLNVTVQAVDGIAYVNFDDPTWSPASLTARGALIYNSSQGNKSIAVLDFGSDKTMSPAFVIVLPANAATSAVIRIT